MKEADYPALYSAADAASQENQRKFLLALAGNLGCLGFAAALSVIDIPTIWFSVLQTGLLLVGMGLTIFLGTRSPQRFWYGTRALAESAKTVTWRFMMRAEPFEGDEYTAQQHFVMALRRIFVSNQHVSAQAVKMQDGQQVTSTMLENRRLPLCYRKTLYHDKRIKEQHEWYVSKAKQNARASKLWFVGLVTVNLAAILSALARTMFSSANHWPTDFLVVVSGSVMTWLQTKRFQELAGSYTLTAHEIGLLRADLPRGTDEREFSVFVADSENAFSREHTQWFARRDAE